MPDEEPPIHDPAARTRPVPACESTEEENDWLGELDEPDELPPRPRRRLLKPTPLALLGVLLVAGGFIGGVFVQKDQQSSSGSAAGTGASLASRFAALRGAGASSIGKSAGGAPGAFPGAGAGAARATTGTVAYLAGNTLYVTSAEGNTVKVNTSPATRVMKAVTTEVRGIHPGETVSVTGATSSSGTVSAESISVGSSTGAPAALFGGSAKGSAGANSGAGSGTAALFGSG
jgi:hypothetical protein